MTFKKFKISVFLLLLTSVMFAQKFDKKFSENFKTDKNVVITINASNADIDVTTWNKNEVSVEAVIEIEGLDKKAAEKYFKNWDFEALGNKNKVQIIANRNIVNSLDKDNVVFFNDMGNLSFKQNFAIDIPEINLEEIIPNLEYLEFDFDKYAKDGENYFFKWKDGVNDITIKSKKEWEKFKKSKKYKKFKKAEEKIIKDLKEHKKRFKRSKRIQLIKAKRELLKEVVSEKKRILSEKRAMKIMALEAKRAALTNVRKQLHNRNFNYSFLSGNNNVVINGKKVKVTKKIIIKVPKDAVFDLNTRHCKVKLPKTKASGSVSYGAFNADELNGGALNISYSPITINSLNACTLFLNNVTDAHVASVANTTLNANSSGLTIDRIHENVEINSAFGELSINKIDPEFNLLKVFLNYSDAIIKTSNLDTTISVDSKKGRFECDYLVKYFDKLMKNSGLSVDFTLPSETSKNNFVLRANFSDIMLK